MHVYSVCLQYQILSSGCWRMCCGRAGLLDEDIQYGKDETDAVPHANQELTTRCSLEVNIVKRADRWTFKLVKKYTLQTRVTNTLSM